MAGTRPGLALRIWSTVTFTFFSRYACTITDSVSPDCVYTDPASVSRGHRELTAKMQATQRNFPGARFRNDKFAQHHGQAVSSWTMLDGTGSAIFTGTSYARYGDDGRLAQMTGFFEPVR